MVKSSAEIRMDRELLVNTCLPMSITSGQAIVNIHAGQSLYHQSLDLNWVLENYDKIGFTTEHFIDIIGYHLPISSYRSYLSRSYEKNSNPKTAKPNRGKRDRESERGKEMES